MIAPATEKQTRGGHGDDDKISGAAVVVASDLVEMVAAGLGWWRDGDDDDAGWSHGGGDVYGGGVVVRRLWVMIVVDLWCGSGCGLNYCLGFRSDKGNLLHRDSEGLDTDNASLAARKGEDVEVSWTTSIVGHNSVSQLKSNDGNGTVTKDFPSMTTVFGKHHTSKNNSTSGPKDVPWYNGDDGPVKEADGENFNGVGTVSYVKKIVNFHTLKSPSTNGADVAMPMMCNLKDLWTLFGPMSKEDHLRCIVLKNVKTPRQAMRGIPVGFWNAFDAPSSMADVEERLGSKDVIVNTSSNGLQEGSSDSDVEEFNETTHIMASYKRYVGGANDPSLRDNCIDFEDYDLYDGYEDEVSD
ncbi:hypothetical protein Tco_0004929 [Tanacetum coccineum]